MFFFKILNMKVRTCNQACAYRHCNHAHKTPANIGELARGLDLGTVPRQALFPLHQSLSDSSGPWGGGGGNYVPHGPKKWAHIVKNFFFCF